MITKSFLLAALASISAGDEQADTAQDDERIVVEGSRIGALVASIESPDPLPTALPINVLEVLETLPDVRAVSTGGAGGTSFVSIRGAEPNFAQILIDGVRVSNPSSSQGGGFDFAQLDPALIESIAIIPTSRSAVHGSDALSGVVSLRLRGTDLSRVSGGGSITADSEDGYALSARLGLGWGNGSLLVSGGRVDTGDLTEASTLERDQVMARFEQGLGQWDLSAFGIYGETERNGFPESSGGPELAANRNLEMRDTSFLTLGLSILGPESAAIRPAFRAGYYDDNVAADTPAIFPGVFDPVPALTSDTDFSRLELTGDLRFRLTDRFDLVAGAGYQREDASSTGTIDIGLLLPTQFAIDRDQTSLFAEAEWRPLAGLTLSLAGRQDWFEERSEASVQGSIEYVIADGLTAFAGYAEGFRLPSLFALAFPLTANPDLLPERSVSWEGGLKWESGTARLRASVFANNYTDLIDFDPVLFTTVNRSETQISGFSLSGEGTLGPSVEWNGSLTVLDFDSVVPLRSRPDWYGHARIAWRPAETLRLGAAATFNSDFLETSIPTGVIELGGHVAVDLFAEWQATKALSLSLALCNALDEDWQDAVGFPAPGRVLRVSAGFAF
ncbi:TonB-dependent receptor [uncultured Erythrobacter sp.]|uniref:TonB-dependent receptor plug domain-containing protein n=1 Tax=uncultured Erythrobacter sp. TaxID=263913 RepID=UPI002616A4C9|nr:TonB-dependent receptor [uncultured Erythrobacter sp.]